MYDKNEVTGVVLAGGLGRRMGGVDKGLVCFNKRPMVHSVLDRLVAQVGCVLINANQHQDRYAEFGYLVVADQLEGFLGPLSGLQTGLSCAQTPWVVTVPCDSPLLPSDLVGRLYEAAARAGASLAIAHTADQVHPVFCLCHTRLLPDLTAYLLAGERRMETWIARHAGITVSFDDQSEGFVNINTLSELQALEGK